MAEDNKIKIFFKNFISQEKTKENLDSQYLLFLKILWNEIDVIIGKNKNQRKNHILDKIELYLTNEDYKNKIDELTLPETEESSLVSENKMDKIKIENIDIINFRGFQANKDGSGRKINFNEKYTLFFAPNGGGKTSLCEAMEWCFCDDSYERSKRKCEPISNYFQNSKQNSPKFNNTKITLTNGYNPIKSNIFNRCFFEKNRIEEFAKLAIQPNTKIQEILGELFGFSDIVDFYKNFSQDISPTELEKRANQNWNMWLDYESHKRLIEESALSYKEKQTTRNKNLKDIIGEKSFEEFKAMLEKERDLKQAFIDNINKDYSTNFSLLDLKNKIRNIKLNSEKYKKLNEEINKNSSALDFELLFQAANTIFMKGYKDKKCPLCDTPFENSGNIFKRSGVIKNPIKKVKEELEKLKKLTKIKSDIVTSKENIIIDFDFIKNEWQKILLNTNDNNWGYISINKEVINIPEINFTDLENKSKQDNIISFIDSFNNIFNFDFIELEKIEKSVLEYKEKIKSSLENIELEKGKLAEIKESIIKLDSANQELISSNKVVETNNEELEKIKKNKENSDYFTKYLQQYKEFYSSLGNFQSSIILKESKNIDEYITGYYRALNFYDNENELVKEIHFPKNIGDEFCVVYEKNPSTCNVLQILSEGHLKTLGLSALLARATFLNSPFIVFDDAINAIDSDHRDNIANLLTNCFSEEDGKIAFGENNWDAIKKYIEDCQIIITSHDRFFDEKVGNLIEKDKQKHYVLYSGDNGIDFCENGTPIDFEAKIENFLKPVTQDIRSAVFYCRIWLEETLLKITTEFKKESNNKPIEFSNSIDKKTRRLKNPELETLINNLISNLSKTTLNPDYIKISAILQSVLDQKDSDFIWFFEILNQESHNRRFDHIDISNAPTSNEVQRIFDKIKEVHDLS